MPGYPFLAETRLETGQLIWNSRCCAPCPAQACPTTEEQITNAERARHLRRPMQTPNFEDRTDPGLRRQSSNPRLRRQPVDHVTEMDALVAYLQMLGTLVDFDSLTPEEIAQ